MSFLDHQGESEFPFEKERVFNAMLKTIPKINGMKVSSADKMQGRIVIKSGVSLTSWGENIPVQLSEISEKRTKVKINSSPKTGILFGGAFDFGKNRKNIEQILSVTSMELSNSQNAAPSETPVVDTRGQQSSYESNGSIQYVLLDKKWHDNKFVVYLLLVFFFPVGVYALWKSRTIAKWWKITVSIIFSLILLYNLGSDDSISTENNTFIDASGNESELNLIEPEKENFSKVESVEKQKININKAKVIEGLKSKAKRDWPNDYAMQEYWINEQMTAYEYMLTIENNSIKEQAQRDWPLDFLTQKFWYNEQLEAKERLK